MKKYITLLAISLICHDSVAEIVRRDFQTVDDLVANVKKEEPTDILYDTNGIIVGMELRPAFSTDGNLRLLSKIKSVKYLLVCNGFVSTNAISALAEYPNLTGLGLVCCGGRSNHFAPLLQCLTNLQSLELAQTSYRTNDAIYLAKMTNLVALYVGGSITKTEAELLPLTNLVNLRRLEILGSDEFINKWNRTMISKFGKRTHFVIPLDEHEIWKMPVEK